MELSLVPASDPVIILNLTHKSQPQPILIVIQQHAYDACTQNVFFSTLLATSCLTITYDKFRYTCCLCRYLIGSLTNSVCAPLHHEPNIYEICIHVLCFYNRRKNSAAGSGSDNDPDVLLSSLKFLPTRNACSMYMSNLSMFQILHKHSTDFFSRQKFKWFLEMVCFFRCLSHIFEKIL